MTQLPKMKIWTGGDEEYSARVQRALFELGVMWIHNHEAGLLHLSEPWLLVGSFRKNTLTATDNNNGETDLKTAYRLTDSGKLVPAEADNDGWIAWHGGECPVDQNTTVEWRTRSNGVNGEMRLSARCLSWQSFGGGGDIIAYRVPSMIFETSQRKEKAMTPCEQYGLRKGQWVWLNREHFYHGRGWIQPRKDDEGLMPFFEPATDTFAEGVAVSLDAIDWSQGIHDEKPDWTPNRNPDPTEPEFWEDAPEWATHWCYGYGKGFCAPQEACSKCVPRPQPAHHTPDTDAIADRQFEAGAGEPEWRGPEDGLPPEGTVCEMWHNDKKRWVRAVVQHHVAEVYEQGSKAMLYACEKSDLRPLRTERERVIEKAMEQLGLNCEQREFYKPEAVLRKAYDAGMLHLPEDRD